VIQATARLSLPTESPYRYASRISRPNASDPEEHAEAWQESLWTRGAADGDINAASKPTLAPVSRIRPPPAATSAGRAQARASQPARVWPALDELLTASDVMAILKVGDIRTARQYMRLAGGFKLGREYRIRRQVLASWIDHRELDAERRASGGQPRARRSRVDPADWRARIKAAAR
jgi:hypothetical protein